MSRPLKCLSRKFQIMCSRYWRIKMFLIICSEEIHNYSSLEMLSSPGEYTHKSQNKLLHRGMHSILASLSVLVRSCYLFIQSVPAMFKVSWTVIGDFAPPSSPQQWNIISHGLPSRKASGRLSHNLVRLGPFGFVCGWAWWEYITFIIRLAPWAAGKMNRILRCDWLPERARWRYLARSRLPAM